MAGELKHKDAGTGLSRTEDNALDRHITDTQALNDMFYFDGTHWVSAPAATIIPLLAHKDTHDPQDGADALDTAAPSELASIQAAAVGVSHSLARADHAHQIQHSIADNHLVTIDGTTNQPVNTDYAKFTADGLEGKSYAEVATDLGKGAASGLASLNASTKVVEQPASISDHLDDTEHGTDAETTKAPTSNRLYDHDVATTGVHGVGVSTICSEATADSKDTTIMNAHKDLTTGVHGVGAGAIVGTALTQELTNKTLTSPKLNENVVLGATATELNLLDLAALTAGEVLVATGAAAASWQSTGVVLSAPDISGAVTAAATLTLPAVTLGGAVTLSDVSIINLKAGTAAINPEVAHRGQFYFTEGAAGVADKLYCIMKGDGDAYSAVQVAIG